MEVDLPQEYIDKWKDYGIEGLGKGNWKIKRHYDSRKNRNPEDLKGLVVGGTGITKRPPLGSSYCCKGINSKGTQCNSWALRGQEYCQFHGGQAHSRVAKNKARRNSRYVGNKKHKLPYVYSKFLSESLQERLEQIAGVDDRYDMSKELDICKATAVDALQMYDAISTMPAETLQQKQAKEQALLSGGIIVREVLNEVINTAGKIVDIDTKRRENVKINDIGVITAQVVEKAYEVFGESDDAIAKVRQFAAEIRQIRLPSEESQQAKGTTLTTRDTVDDIVKAMDATIPCKASESEREINQEGCESSIVKTSARG
jgi:hypothetical protein